mgnify:CR=1 FL=1
MKYAINLTDMTKDDIVKQFVILPVCPNKIVINVNKNRLDETAIVLECDETRAKAIVDVVRSKYHRNLFRCYESKTGKGGWKRI